MPQVFYSPAFVLAITDTGRRAQFVNIRVGEGWERLVWQAGVVRDAGEEWGSEEKWTDSALLVWGEGEAMRMEDKLNGNL